MKYSIYLVITIGCFVSLYSSEMTEKKAKKIFFKKDYNSLMYRECEHNTTSYCCLLAQYLKKAQEYEDARLNVPNEEGRTYWQTLSSGDKRKIGAIIETLLIEKNIPSEDRRKESTIIYNDLGC